MPDLITPAEYARRRGVSRAAVTYAVKAGRIRLIDGKVDPEVADIQWEKNTRKVIGQGGVSAMSAVAAAPPASAPPAVPVPGYDYENARAKREHHEARIAEMKERERAGELVESALVVKALTDIGAIVRASLERIPARLAAQLAAETSEEVIYALLETELGSVLDDIRQAVLRLPEAVTTPAEQTQ